MNLQCFQIVPTLDDQSLQNIKVYKYSTNPLTVIEVYIFEHWWNFVVYLTPSWIAPNLMTLSGLFLPLVQFYLLAINDWTLTQLQPNWYLFIHPLSIFVYQTMDACDGKQARKTQNCSSLGQLLDHNLDQISFTIFFLAVCQSLHLGQNLPLILSLVPPILSPHFSIEFRKHFTNVHITVVGYFGATEELLIHILVYLYAFLQTGEEVFDVPFYQFSNGWEITPGVVVCIFSFVTGFHYNIENFIYGIIGSKDRLYSIMCMIPLVQTYITIIIAFQSKLYEDYSLFYLMGTGMFLTYATAHLNIASTSSTRFNWLYFDPFIFWTILYLEKLQILLLNQCLWAYTALFLYILFKYMYLMTSMVSILTKYLDINFITVRKKKPE